MAAYRGRGRFRVEEQTVDDFINGSSLLTLFPFLRQGVIDLATKVHESPIPVLPLAGPGIGQRLVLMDEE
jgi:hypothetical protein